MGTTDEIFDRVNQRQVFSGESDPLAIGTQLSSHEIRLNAQDNWLSGLQARIAALESQHGSTGTAFERAPGPIPSNYFGMAEKAAADRREQEQWKAKQLIVDDLKQLLSHIHLLSKREQLKLPENLRHAAHAALHKLES